MIPAGHILAAASEPRLAALFPRRLAADIEAANVAPERGDDGLDAGLRARARKEAAALRAETMVETLRLFAVLVDTGAFYRDLSGAGVTDPLAEDEVMTRRRAIPTRLEAPDLAAATRAARRAVHERALSAPAAILPEPVIEVSVIEAPGRDEPEAGKPAPVVPLPEPAAELAIELFEGLSLADIRTVVARHYGIAAADMLGREKRPVFVEARGAWAYFARQAHELSWSALAAAAGRTNRATVRRSARAYAGARGLDVVRDCLPAMADAVVAETLPPPPCRSDLAAVRRLAAAEARLPVRLLASGAVRRDIAAARWRGFYLAARDTNASTTQIAKAFRCDHSTVLNGIARYCARHDLPHPRREGRR